MQNLRSLFQVAVPFQEVGRRINHNSRHIAFRSGTLRIAPHFSSNSGPNVDTYQRQRRRQSGEKQFQPRHHHRPQGGTNQFKHDKFRNESDNSSVGKLIRLSKRMSELDICSRREADVWIEQGRVLVNGEKAVLGAKIDPDLVNERDIEILTISRQRGEQNHRGNDDDVSFDDQNIHRKQQRMPRHDIDFASIVLHKPVGYVSSVYGLCLFLLFGLIVGFWAGSMDPKPHCLIGLFCICRFQDKLNMNISLPSDCLHWRGCGSRDHNRRIRSN